MDSTTTVFVVHAHTLVREGLNALLARDARFVVAGVFGAARGLLTALDRGLRADAYVVDLEVPGWRGIDVVREVLARDGASRVLVISDVDTVDAAVECIRAGATGFVASRADPDELLRAVEAVARGERVVDPALVSGVLAALADPGARASLESLSAREREVFERLVAGIPVKQIAYELGVSPKTVSTYRQRILEKLALRNNAELTAYAVRRGLAAIGDP